MKTSGSDGHVQAGTPAGEAAPAHRQARPGFGRRAFLEGATGAAAALALSTTAGEAFARPTGLVAKPPAGFSPLRLPGRVARVGKSGVMQANGLWPEQAAATAMLTRVMAELTGKQDLGDALKLFVHPSDKVAIKPNGIAGKKGATMATNKELVVAMVHGLID